ncbi:MAG: aminoglycoside phosphotransferase family protein [Actinomycetota bacterium]
MHTPRHVIDAGVRSVCGRLCLDVRPLSGGGLNETYEVLVDGGSAVVVRIARRAEPWFRDEEHLISIARGVGIHGPDVLGVEHIEHEGELLSFSVLKRADGRPLHELVGVLAEEVVDGVIIEAGEMLARLHTLHTDRGICRRPELPGEEVVGRAIDAASRFGSDAGSVANRGVQLLREAGDSAEDASTLVHGDWLPKHFLIDSSHRIATVIDWELAGPSPAAYDIAHWEVAARAGLNERVDLLRRGYQRIVGADVLDAIDHLVPAFIIQASLDVLGWRNPAAVGRQRRCIDLIQRCVDQER